MEDMLNIVLEVGLVILAVGILLAFIRAVKGPRFTDRIMAMNMIGTMTTAMICILSAYLHETVLVDVALVYTLLSFLSVVIICRVVSLHHQGRELHLKRKAEEAKEQ